MRDIRLAQSPEKTAVPEDARQLLRGRESEQRLDVLLFPGKGKGELLFIGRNVTTDDTPDVLAVRERYATQFRALFQRASRSFSGRTTA